MIAMPRHLNFRVTAGYFLLCMPFLLSGCGESAQRPGLQDTSSSDDTLQFSATLSYEDRQMMRCYLVQELLDGIIAMTEMQAQIDLNHGQQRLCSQGRIDFSAPAKRIIENAGNSSA